MATSRPDYSPPEDLTRCSICRETINEPKVLHCLHTFCLECLREWSQPNLESVTCPILACKKTTPMPSDGVDGLPGNVFVSSLIEKSPSRGRQVPCVCCDETNNDVLARCVDCNGFLCQKGIDQHQMRLLRSHQVVRLEDIKSGKVDLSKLTGKKKPTCSDHEGQQLWFYCETCGILICRDCTVVNHQKPEHTYMELRSIVADQRSKIQQLVTKNETNREKVTQAIENTATALQRLAINVKNTDAKIDQTVEKVKRHVDNVCRDEKQRLSKQQANFAAKSSESITSIKEILQGQKLRLQTALDMSKQVLISGSDYDIASMYKQLSSSLQELCEIEPASAPEDIDKLPEFNADYKITTDFNSIGTFEKTTERLSTRTWLIEREFGNKDAPGKLSQARGISLTPTGDIVVSDSDCWSFKPVKVYSQDAHFKFKLDKSSINAWDVAVSQTGQVYVTTDQKKAVRVHGTDGRYLSQFAAVSPSGVSSDAENTNLRGLAINEKGQLLVGEVNNKYISIHDLSGVHINSIQVSILPYFIATTRQGNIIVSPNASVGGVQILDSKGTLQHVINAPEAVSNWIPTGLCCSINGEICISNRGEPKGVFCFSSTGVYLGCITSKFNNNPWGVALLQNDEKMVVVESDDYQGSCVKMFRSK